MKKALIHINRIAQVVADGAEFPVAPPLVWVACADDVSPETHFFNGTAIVLLPLPPAPPSPIDFSNVDNVEKALKALGLVVASWNGKTPAQLKVAFKTAWDSLP